MKESWENKLKIMFVNWTNLKKKIKKIYKKK